LLIYYFVAEKIVYCETRRHNLRKYKQNTHKRINATQTHTPKHTHPNTHTQTHTHTPNHTQQPTQTIPLHLEHLLRPLSLPHLVHFPQALFVLCVFIIMMVRMEISHLLLSFLLLLIYQHVCLFVYVCLVL
jgi:hypothetical protein